MIHHGEFLRAAARDDEVVYHMQHDHKMADIDEQERAMCEYVVKLNGEPGKIVEEDVQALRDAGFDDRSVLDIVLVTANFNFMNRLADGLGLRAQEQFRTQMERGNARVEEKLSVAKAQLA